MSLLKEGPGIVQGPDSLECQLLERMLLDKGHRLIDWLERNLPDKNLSSVLLLYVAALFATTPAQAKAQAGWYGKCLAVSLRFEGEKMVQDAMAAGAAYAES